jgi:carboxylesterase
LITKHSKDFLYEYQILLSATPCSSIQSLYALNCYGPRVYRFVQRGMNQKDRSTKLFYTGNMGDFYTNVDSFFLRGDNPDTAILLIHGLSGSPADLRGIGDYLHLLGYTISCPQLSGHGTNEYDLIAYTYQDWILSAETAYFKLHAEFKNVVVVGYSMGGLIAINIAAYHPVKKLVLCAPALLNRKFVDFILPLGKYFIHWYSIGGGSKRKYKPPYTSKSYPRVSTKTLHQHFKLIHQTKPLLSKITTPTLLLHGIKDTVVPLSASTYILEHIKSTENKLITFPTSGHGVLLGPEREAVWQAVAEFVK